MYEANFQDDAVSYTCDLIKHYDNQQKIIVNVVHIIGCMLYLVQVVKP